MKFTVDRSKWLRRGVDGRGCEFVDSVLLNSNGHMCCLGFLAKACGANDKEILDVPCPSHAEGVAWPKGVLRTRDPRVPPADSVTCQDIMVVNDDMEHTDTDVETVLTQKFADLGIEVEFVGA